MLARTHARKALVVSAVVSLVIASALGARAQTPPRLAKYAGEYKYSGTREQGTAIVENAFDDSLANLNAVMRTMAKQAMTQYFAERIVIETPPGKIALKVGELDKISAELDRSTTIKNPDGITSSQITYHFEGGKITETVKAPMQTVVTTVSQLSADGKTLQREVTVTGGIFEKPVKYRLTYVRK